MGLLNRVKKVKIPTHEFRIQIPIIQKKNLLTPEENNTLAQYIISLGDVQESKTFVKASMSDWQLHTHNNMQMLTYQIRTYSCSGVECYLQIGSHIAELFSFY